MAAGILDYTSFIDIFTTTEDVKNTFPRDQYKYTYDFGVLGADGWASTLTWMTLIADSVSFDSNNEPNFANSTVIGYFIGGSANQGSSGTMSFPANMYTGPILPGFERNIPITAVNITWTKGTQQFQKQLLLIQNWEPGTAIGDPTLDDNYIPIQGVTSNLEIFLESGPVLFGEPFSLSAVTDIPSEVAELSVARFYIQQPGDDRLIGTASFVGQRAELTTATDYGTGDPRNINSGTYTVYAIRPGRREYIQSISNTLTQIIYQGVPLVVNLTESPDPITVAGTLSVTATATTATGYYLETGPINSTATVTLIPNANSSATSSSVVTQFVNGILTATFALTNTWLDTTLTTSSSYTITTSTFNEDVFTATAIVSTNHTDSITWNYNRGSKLTGGTTASTFVATGTKTYTTTRKPITITAQEQFGYNTTIVSTGSTNITFNKNGPVVSFKASAANSRAIVGNTGSVAFSALYTSTYQLSEFTSTSTTKITHILKPTYFEYVLHPQRTKVLNATGIQVGATFTYLTWYQPTPGQPGLAQRNQTSIVTNVNYTENWIEINDLVLNPAFFTSPEYITNPSLNIPPTEDSVADNSYDYMIFNKDIVFTNPTSIIPLAYPTVANTATYRVIGIPSQTQFRFDFLPYDLSIYDSFTFAGKSWSITSFNTSTKIVTTDDWTPYINIDSDINQPAVFTLLNLIPAWNNPYSFLYVAADNGNPLNNDGLTISNLRVNDANTGIQTPDYWIKCSALPKDLKVGDFIVFGAEAELNGTYPENQRPSFSRFNILGIDKTKNMVKVNGILSYYFDNVATFHYIFAAPSGGLRPINADDTNFGNYKFTAGQPISFWEYETATMLGYYGFTAYQTVALGTATTSTFTGSAVEWTLSAPNLNTGTYYVSGAINTTPSLWDFPTVPKNSTDLWKLVVAEPPLTEVYGTFYAGTQTDTLILENYANQQFYSDVSFYEGATLLGTAGWNKVGNTQTARLALGVNIVQTATNVTAVWPGSTSTYRLNSATFKYKGSTVGVVPKYDSKVTATNILVDGVSTSSIAYGQKFTATVSVLPISGDYINDPQVTGIVYMTTNVGTGTSTLLTSNTLTNSSTTLTVAAFYVEQSRFNTFFTATVSGIYGGDASHVATKSTLVNFNVAPGKVTDLLFINYVGTATTPPSPYSGGLTHVLAKLGDYTMNANAGNCNLQINYKIVFRTDISINFFGAIGAQTSYVQQPSSSNTSTIIPPYIVNDPAGSTFFPGRLDTPTGGGGLSNQTFTTTAGAVRTGSQPEVVVKGTVNYSCLYNNGVVPITIPIYVLLPVDDQNITSTILRAAAVSVSTYQLTAQTGVNKFTPVLQIPDNPF